MNNLKNEYRHEDVYIDIVIKFPSTNYPLLNFSFPEHYKPHLLINCPYKNEKDVKCTLGHNIFKYSIRMQKYKNEKKERQNKKIIFSNMEERCQNIMGEFRETLDIISQRVYFYLGNTRIEEWYVSNSDEESPICNGWHHSFGEE